MLVEYLPRSVVVEKDAQGNRFWRLGKTGLIKKGEKNFRRFRETTTLLFFPLLYILLCVEVFWSGLDDAKAMCDGEHIRALEKSNL